jgi:Cytochrome c554 and c-prime
MQAANNFRWILSSLTFLTATVAAHGQQTATSATPYVFGAKHCTGCHDQPSKKTDNCRMTEWMTWNHLDRHRIAFDWFDEAGKASAAGKRAQAMAENLGIKDLTTAQECIGCHSYPVAKSTPTSYFETPLERTKEGVTCVACHGGSKEWVVEHVAAADPAWKSLSGVDRWQKLGMVDLKNPVTQARACLSCHVGDTDEKLGRKITHEIYAAGHPPLPGIEVSAFIAEEPRHWLSSSEKKAGNRASAGTSELLAVSGLATLAAQLDLFEKSHLPHVAKKDSGPEIAVYDCYACHHSLGGQQSKWRQARSVSGAPGRPRLPQWPRVLVRYSLINADPANWQANEIKLKELLAKVDGEISQSPYAIPATVDGSAFQAARQLISGQIKTLESRWLASGSLKPENATEILTVFINSMLNDANSGTLDYDTARQVAWAIRSATGALPTNSAGKLKTDLDRLDALAGLSLRAEKHDPLAPPPVKSDQQSVTDLLASRLALLNNWHPQEFRRVLGELVGKLEPN